MEKGNWSISKVIITITLTSIITSVVGFGGTYMAGFISAPEDIKKINAKRTRDSLAVRSEYNLLKLDLEIRERRIRRLEWKYRHDSILHIEVKRKLRINNHN